MPYLIEDIVSPEPRFPYSFLTKLKVCSPCAILKTLLQLQHHVVSGHGSVLRRRRRMRREHRRAGRTETDRAGVASLDYVLVLGVMLPMVAVILRIAPQIMNLAYEMICVLVSWPFL